LERDLSIVKRDLEIREVLGPTDVRIRPVTVGICGSDVHYCRFGRIGPYVVNDAMILGHEASGVIVEVGSAVTRLQVGDRVCMEPGVPESPGKATLLGLYNLEPSVRFWATPPVHGVLREHVVHPEAFTYKLPDAVSFAEGALVEPMAVGVHAATKARVRPGDIAVVVGAGPIGILTALSALAAGCAEAIVSDVHAEKLAIAGGFDGIRPVNVTSEDLREVVASRTGNWGADVVFEASGVASASDGILDLVAPGGTLILVGMPEEPIPFDVVAAQTKEVRVETVFRYANVFQRALELIASGKIRASSLITDTFQFAEAVEAFEFAKSLPKGSVKIQIQMP